MALNPRSYMGSICDQFESKCLYTTVISRVCVMNIEIFSLSEIKHKVNLRFEIVLI